MTGPQQYRHRTRDVEALQWTGDNTTDVQAFTSRAIPPGRIYEGDATIGELSGFDTFEFLGRQRGRLWVLSLASWVDVVPGTWIVRDRSFYFPCAPQWFAEQYAREPLTGA